MNFYVRRGTQEYGPYSEADLRSYVASGNIQPVELARAEGSAQLATVQSILATPPPPMTNASAPPPPYAQPASTAAQPVNMAVPPGNVATPYQQPYTQPYAVRPGYQQKERIAYILLGVFLGTFGVHNFYAGYTGRAVAQLLITVLTFFLGSIISFIWAIVDVCTVTADASGVPFK